jgi:DNA-binding XRE family transcriptional regulator
MLEITTIKDVKVQIGMLCKQQRKAHGLSRDDLAKVLDISRTTIQNIENGKNANLDTLLKLANHFGMLQTIFKGVAQISNNQSNISLY